MARVCSLISSSNFSTLGSEKVTNGSFATDTAWTKGAGWSYVSADQNMDHAPGNTATLSQNVSAVAGELYACTFYIRGSDYKML